MQGKMQWSFRFRFTSAKKVYFAFFYPWSNEENSRFLNGLESRCKQDPSIYWYRAPIIRSLEGRPVEFLVISSNKFKLHKEDKIEDEHLFKGIKKPHGFAGEKKAIVISARVHPGEVPGSHVMTGIL